jgi:hypothetical protein
MADNNLSDRELAIKRYDIVLRYLGTDTQIFWTRSHLFLGANVVLVGFVLREIPVETTAHMARIVALLISATVGGFLCHLWWVGIAVARKWTEHWKRALCQWEEAAFGDVNLFRKRPEDIPQPSRIAESACTVFAILWALVALYLLGCLVLKVWGCTLP